MLIILSGSKGAGKSTTAQRLLTELENAIYLGLDEIRRTFTIDLSRDIREKNEAAFEIIMTEAKEASRVGLHVVIDCGVSKERAERLETLAQAVGVPLYKFFLKASYDTQLERVQKRDKAKGRETSDIARFDEIYYYFNKKDLTGYTVLETDKLNVDQVVGVILRTITV